MLPSIVRVVGLVAILGATAKRAPPDPVDLNAASVQELMSLPGIGRKRAEDIVRQRKQVPYQKTWDLLRVRGIGRRTYARLKPYIRIGPAPPVSAAR